MKTLESLNSCITFSIITISKYIHSWLFQVLEIDKNLHKKLVRNIRTTAHTHSHTHTHTHTKTPLKVVDLFSKFRRFPTDPFPPSATFTSVSKAHKKHSHAKHWPSSYQTCKTGCLLYHYNRSGRTIDHQMNFMDLVSKIIKRSMDSLLKK